MKQIALIYHQTLAAIQNWRARRASRVLSVAGASSNRHEKEAAKIKQRLEAGYE